MIDPASLPSTKVMRLNCRAVSEEEPGFTLDPQPKAVLAILAQQE